MLLAAEYLNTIQVFVIEFEFIFRENIQFDYDQFGNKITPKSTYYFVFGLH